jgi:hypothetical protein
LLKNEERDREERGALPLEHPSRKLSFLHLREMIDFNKFQRSGKIVDIHVDPGGRSPKGKALSLFCPAIRVF